MKPAGAPLHVHQRHSGAPLPLSIMARSAGARVAGVGAILIILWLAVYWAISLP
jgi:hypothetical protein